MSKRILAKPAKGRTGERSEQADKARVRRILFAQPIEIQDNRALQRLAKNYCPDDRHSRGRPHHVSEIKHRGRENMGKKCNGRTAQEALDNLASDSCLSDSESEPESCDSSDNNCCTKEYSAEPPTEAPAAPSATPEEEEEEKKEEEEGCLVEVTIPAGKGMDTIKVGGNVEVEAEVVANEVVVSEATSGVDTEEAAGVEPVGEVAASEVTSEVVDTKEATGVEVEWTSTTTTPRSSAGGAAAAAEAIKRAVEKVGQVPQVMGKAMDEVVEAFVSAGRDIAQATDRIGAKLRRSGDSFNNKVEATWVEVKGDIKSGRKQVVKVAKGFGKAVKSGLKTLTSLVVCGSSRMPVEEPMAN